MSIANLRIVCIILTLTTLACCEDTMLQRTAQAPTHKTIPGGTADDFKPNPGESYRFPKIIETEYTSDIDLFAHDKCRAWRIEWPTYDSDFSHNLMPSVFSLINGELNSFNFLNTTSPLNTQNAHMSLFVNSKVESANIMWDELDHAFDLTGMPSVFLAQCPYDLDIVQKWVTKRPDLFEYYWPEGTTETEFYYEEGDIIQFKVASEPAPLYGGIRIVSMSPRIIEVYLDVKI